jgi:hypothetical protein
LKSNAGSAALSKKRKMTPTSNSIDGEKSTIKKNQKASWSNDTLKIKLIWSPTSDKWCLKFAADFGESAVECVPCLDIIWSINSWNCIESKSDGYCGIHSINSMLRHVNKLSGESIQDTIMWIFMSSTQHDKQLPENLSQRLRTLQTMAENGHKKRITCPF